MQVKLQWITPNAENEILYCARVSNPKGQNKSSTELLAYCIKHGHWSVFEMANICIEIDGSTRDITRQMLRHSSLRPQEFSQRYADVRLLAKEGVVRECRMQDTKNRQNSLPCEDEDLKAEFIDAQIRHWEDSIENYSYFLDRGVAKEQCRIFLPEGMTPTRLYLNSYVRNWLHFCQVRMGNGTQKEHVEVATAVFGIIQEHLPVTAKAFEALYLRNNANEARR